MTIDQSGNRANLQMAAYLRSIGADVRSAVDHVEDSGNPSAGDGGGTQPLVFTTLPHGLNPGDSVELVGTNYDGTKTVEPVDETSFLIDDTPFAENSTGGTWSPVVIY